MGWPFDKLMASWPFTRRSKRTGAAAHTVVDPGIPETRFGGRGAESHRREKAPPLGLPRRSGRTDSPAVAYGPFFRKSCTPAAMNTRPARRKAYLTQPRNWVGPFMSGSKNAIRPTSARITVTCGQENALQGLWTGMFQMAFGWRRPPTPLTSVSPVAKPSSISPARRGGIRPLSGPATARSGPRRRIPRRAGQATPVACPVPACLDGRCCHPRIAIGSSGRPATPAPGRA